MVRPYRVGDWFAIARGDGQFSPGIVARGTRKVVFAYIFRCVFEHLPSLDNLAALRPCDAVWHGAISDRAIVQQRWPVIRARKFDASAWPLVDDVKRIASPLALEELVLIGTMPRALSAVFDVRVAVTAIRLDALHDGATLQWREPLPATSLENIERWIETRPDAQIRLYGSGVAQLRALVGWRGLRTLHLGAILPGDASAQHLRASASVRSLFLESATQVRAFVESFPHVRTLRIATNAQTTLDLHDLQHLHHLRALDLSGVSLERVDALTALPNLRALRLSRCVGDVDARQLAALPLRTLALEHQPNLHALQPLAHLRSLEELTLLGFWQLDISELEWIFQLPHLRRVTLDIGGRRKNVELYRRGRWASARPFGCVCRIGAEEQVPAEAAMNPAPTGEPVSL